MKKSLIALVAIVVAIAMSACCAKPATESNADQPNEWDAYLDQYEAVVDSAVLFSQTASIENMDAMLSFTSASQKAGDMALEVSQHAEELSPAQADRFSEISEKLGKAADEFQKKLQP